MIVSRLMTLSYKDVMQGLRHLTEVRELTLRYFEI